MAVQPIEVRASRLHSMLSMSSMYLSNSELKAYAVLDDHYNLEFRNCFPISKMHNDLRQRRPGMKLQMLFMLAK
jgi:hypothetical protein